MKKISNILIEKPTSLVKIYKNKKLERVATNLVTQNGLDAIMESTLVPIVDPVGGRLRNIVLGHGTSPITFTSDIPTDIIEAGPLITTATVTYATENNKRYAYATVFYSFNNPVTSVEPLRQVMITTETNSDPILFGLSLEEPVDLSEPVEIDIAYTIRFPIISSITEILTGGLYGVTYTLYGKFNTEIPNVVRYEWPANTSGSTDSSTALSRFYINNTLLGQNSGRYTSTRESNNYLYIQNITTRVLSLVPGNVNITTLEVGAVVPATNGYTLRYAFNGSISKSSSELMDIDLILNINWGDPEEPNIPEAYAAIEPPIVLSG